MNITRENAIKAIGKLEQERAESYLALSRAYEVVTIARNQLMQVCEKIMENDRIIAMSYLDLVT